MWFKYNDNHANKTLAGQTFRVEWGYWDDDARLWVPGYYGNGKHPEVEYLLINLPYHEQDDPVWAPIMKWQSQGVLQPGLELKSYYDRGLSNARYMHFRKEVILPDDYKFYGPRRFIVDESDSIFTKRAGRRDIVVWAQNSERHGWYFDEPDPEWPGRERRVWFFVTTWIACENGRAFHGDGPVPDYIYDRLYEWGFTYPKGETSER